METEEEVDILMSSDVYSATLSTKSITFSRAQTGWLFREDKTVGARSRVAAFHLLPEYMHTHIHIYVDFRWSAVEHLRCPQQRSLEMLRQVLAD